MFTKITDDLYLRLDQVIAIEFNGTELHFAFAGHDGFTCLELGEKAANILNNYLEERSYKLPKKFYPDETKEINNAL